MIAKLRFNEEVSLTVEYDPDTMDFKIVEENSGYEAEGTLAEPE